MSSAFLPDSNTGPITNLLARTGSMPGFPYFSSTYQEIHMTTQLFILALIIGFHAGPAWALLLILLAGLARIFPAVIVMELVGPIVIRAINKHRR